MAGLKKRYTDLCSLIVSSTELECNDDSKPGGGGFWSIGNNNNEIYLTALEALGKYPFDKKTNSNMGMVIEDLVNEVIMEDLKKIVKPKKPKKITFKIKKKQREDEEPEWNEIEHYEVWVEENFRDDGYSRRKETEMFRTSEEAMVEYKRLVKLYTNEDGFYTVQIDYSEDGEDLDCYEYQLINEP